MSPDNLHNCPCPACGHHVAVPFFDGGSQPLATIAWPSSAEEARALTRLPLSFVRCIDCGHIFNKEFDYSHVPYSDKPNLMFNRAAIWSQHLLQVRDVILSRLPANPVVVEVGCGEGHLLRALAEARPAGRYVGFDPNSAINTDGTIEARKELFDPAIHLEEYKPDMVVSRHVLEHLMNPQGFLQRMTFSAGYLNHPVMLFIEVPCIDRVFETGRIADFYFEHNSHFTSESFSRMLESSGAAIVEIGHGYDGEVIHGLSKLRGSRAGQEFAQQAADFKRQAEQAKVTIGAQLDGLHTASGRTAIWGGTGKGAAFMNYYGVDAARFPLVVDSDLDKVGTFVPGTGQLIQSRDVLVTQPANTIIIPTQWRARDIVAEMRKCGIRTDAILIEHKGKLVDFLKDDHPYNRELP